MGKIKIEVLLLSVQNKGQESELGENIQMIDLYRWVYKIIQYKGGVIGDTIKKF